MENRICKACGEEKEISNFMSKGWRNGVQRHSYECYSCNYKNPTVAKRTRIKKQQMVERFVEYKRVLFCADCNMSFVSQPWLCDFHHLDPSTKERSVSYMSTAFAWNKTLKEIAKCIPLCSNCHRTRHHLRDDGLNVFRVGVNNNGHKK